MTKIKIFSFKNVYQEILYNVIYSKNLCLFIPNSDNAKFIVDIVNKHQIVFNLLNIILNY